MLFREANYFHIAFNITKIVAILNKLKSDVMEFLINPGHNSIAEIFLFGDVGEFVLVHFFQCTPLEHARNMK